MTLKNAGREKPKKYKGCYCICEICKARLYFSELEETDSIERIADVSIIFCPECGSEFTLK